MQITFLGGVGTVTGSKYLLEFSDKKVLIDCGLFQGLKELRLRNWDAPPVDPKTVDAIILTHAHIDHTGYLPLFVKNGYSGPIYCSEGTRDLCGVLLPDSGHLQEDEARRANKYGYSKHSPALPLYTEEEAYNALKQFQSQPFKEILPLFEDFTVEFLPAGHIIGASLVRIRHHHKTLVFTGDLGRPHDPVMCSPTVIDDTDYLVVESTYGDRLHPVAHPKDALKDVITKTIKRGGTILIPAFAVGRAQNILHYVALLKQENAIPDIPIFLDSPMAVDATDILLRHCDEISLAPQACRTLNTIATFINSPEESKALDSNVMPKIIIAASGMLTGGRILHHIKAYGPDHRTTLLLTGYQALGTRGDRLLNGEKFLKIYGEMVPINAEISVLTNTSAHADYSEILAWLSHFKRPPQKVFITHGDPKAAASLKQKIDDQFGWTCVVPHYKQVEQLG